MASSTTTNQHNPTPYPPYYTSSGTSSCSAGSGIHLGNLSAISSGVTTGTISSIITTGPGDIYCKTIDAKDIVVDGTSLSDVIKSIQHRLNILVPNQEHLERSVILADLYEQYKVAEALLYGGNDE